MTNKPLYRYVNADGSITITPRKRSESDIPYSHRLIADEGKILTDGTTQTYCVDTQNVEEWSEIDDPNPPEPEGE